MIESLRNIIDDVILAFGPLVDTAQDPPQFKELLADLGWTVNSVPQPLLDLAADGSDLVGTISSDPGEISTTQAIDSVKRLIDAIDAIRTKPDTAFPSGIDITSFKATIGRDLLDYFIVEYLLRNRYKVGDVLRLAGLIRLVETPGIGLRQPYLKRQVMWNRIGELITDPAKGFRETFDWNSPTPQLAQAISDLASLLESYGLQLLYFRSKGDQLAFVNGGATVPIDESFGIDLNFDDQLGAPTGFAAGLQLLLRSPIAARGPAILLLPYARLNGAQEVALSDTIALSIRGDADFTKGVAITLAPGRPPEVQAGFLGGTPVSPAEIKVELRVTPSADQPERLLLGTSDASRLSIKTVALSAGTRLVSSDKLDAFVAFDLENARVVIKPAPGEADSFITSFVGAEGISAELSFGLRLSSLTGFHLRGSSSLEASFPVDVQLGPIDVQALSIALKPGGQSVDLEVGATVSGNLGPLDVVIERFGFKLTAQFPDPPTGNLGPLDLSFSFKPPNGVGLSIDAPVVVGGGYLFFDPQKEEYGGILQLEIAETIAVKAIGLLTTRLPDGSKGFSLVVIMSAEGFAPIQLGFGFTLTGIGGLLGINRTVMVDVLRSGLKNGTLGSILFPDDPIRNAPQIVSDLRAVFPPVKDRHVFGPMAIIGWGTPTILTLEIGLLLELPEPVRLIILGRLRAVLPDEDHALVQVRMDAIGIIDFNQDDVSLDATLYDSRILQFVLTGDMALRANWGAEPNFVLAIGGFNPRFPAPAGFPQLARLALSLGDSDNPRLRFESYLALTSNTVQFGARLDFSYSAAGLTLAGFLGFDALFQFAPFEFIADVGAMVALKRGGSVLMGVFLDMTLAGPTPWHVWGTATFKVLFFKVSIRFDHRFGHEEPPALPAPIDVLTLLVEALSDRRNWSSALPRGEPPIVSFQDSATTRATLGVHPLAELTVRQRVVPLNRPVTKFGNAPLAEGATSFTLAVSGIDNTPSLVRDAFALAQYQEMSDEEKLTRPPFEMQDAGLQFGVEEAAYQYEALPDTAIAYETLIIDPARPAETVTVTEPYVLPQTVLEAVVSLGAAGQAAIRRSGSSRYRMLERAA